jgi:hypothetical protein
VTGAHRRAGLDLNPQPGSEPDSFDCKVLRGERQLLVERDVILSARAQRVSQEVGEENAHPTRTASVSRSQRGDGVQAVEHEVWVDLGTQRGQLGASGKQLELDRATLRRLRGLNGDDDVVESGGNQEEQTSNDRARGPLVGMESHGISPRRGSSVAAQTRPTPTQRALVVTAAARCATAARHAAVPASSGNAKQMCHDDSTKNAWVTTSGTSSATPVVQWVSRPSGLRRRDQRFQDPRR